MGVGSENHSGNTDMKPLKTAKLSSPPAGASGGACGGQKFSPEVVLTTPTLLSAFDGACPGCLGFGLRDVGTLQDSDSCTY